MGQLDADLLTTAEVEALLRACSSRAATGVRNRAMIALLWRTGLRISEALALKLKEVQVEVGGVLSPSDRSQRCAPTSTCCVSVCTARLTTCCPSEIAMLDGG